MMKQRDISFCVTALLSALAAGCGAALVIVTARNLWRVHHTRYRPVAWPGWFTRRPIPPLTTYEEDLCLLAPIDTSGNLCVYAYIAGGGGAALGIVLFVIEASSVPYAIITILSILTLRKEKHNQRKRYPRFGVKQAEEMSTNPPHRPPPLSSPISCGLAP
jgi:hypothetical protein